ncbi:MAG: 1-deoxy-D-xylulose-5-phosphate reductoisomerase [Syntrophomonadaceae bacterium]|nr:1-deoxy-D-xylulose-5-phosphate reductoisomerase [Syntrophomonadaceae bacterium]
MNGSGKTRLVILGSTGSIGRQALEVVDMHEDRFQVVGIAARDEVQVLNQQIKRYQPRKVAVTDTKVYKKLKGTLPGTVELLQGMEGLCEIASMAEADVVLIALSGSVGILPTLAGIKSKKRIALANKETLVAAGDIVMQQVRENSVLLLPVDSEHSAIFQCLAGDRPHLKRIWLTASGGPFRHYTKEQLNHISVEMALKHPNWDMGPKITIDSATLMNKGLEVIEAHHLFHVDYQAIEVIVQKESIIHSMVEFIDGSFLAHLGVPDMRIPIQYALTYPLRMDSPAKKLDFRSLGTISFEPPDLTKFPSLSLAYSAGKTGGTMPAVLNAANEVAVGSFLAGRIRFIDIPCLVEKVMLKHDVIHTTDVGTIMEIDAWAREICEGLITKKEAK